MSPVSFAKLGEAAKIRIKNKHATRTYLKLMIKPPII
jgi:hypothetical protein